MPSPRPDAPAAAQAIERERFAVLYRLERWLEMPMVVLGLGWLALLIVELVWGLSPLLEAVGTAIWLLFIVDFAVKLTLAPRKLSYLRSRWLTVVSLVVPAIRVFRIGRAVRALRLARTARGLRLVRVVGSLNRGMRALGRSMHRRGFGYVAALTAIVTLAGAAGMYAFERTAPDGRGFDGYGTALWWTAMIMTTMGSEYWPRTAEGRVLCLLLALYAFAAFGYVTAALASYFIGRDAADPKGELAGVRSMRELRAEVAALREEIRALAAFRGGS